VPTLVTGAACCGRYVVCEMREALVVLGAGGQARETYWYALAAGVRVVVFVDETLPAGTTFTIGSVPQRVVTDWSEFRSDSRLAKGLYFIVGVGDPHLKKRLVALALASGLTPAPTLIHARAAVHGADCTVGRGGLITPGCNITTHVTIGDYVIVNPNCTVGHDVIIKDYVTCNPGCHISGNVVLEEGVLLGTGTAVREKTTIASYVTVGGQSFVGRSVTEANTTVVGVPARPLVRRP
jgi:sugar O-acyltransferase (sialic acid O-acetyltransferase NeuD family)